MVYTAPKFIGLAVKNLRALEGRLQVESEGRNRTQASRVTDGGIRLIQATWSAQNRECSWFNSLRRQS